MKSQHEVPPVIVKLKDRKRQPLAHVQVSISEYDRKNGGGRTIVLPYNHPKTNHQSGALGGVPVWVLQTMKILRRRGPRFQRVGDVENVQMDT